MLVSLENGTFKQAIKLGFKVSSNEVEYKALLNGLKLAMSFRIGSLKVFSNSQLVVKKLKGELEAKEERMKLYLWKSNELMS